MTFPAETSVDIFCLAQRAWAARRADSIRSSTVSFSLVALAPRLPSLERYSRTGSRFMGIRLSDARRTRIMLAVEELAP